MAVPSLHPNPPTPSLADLLRQIAELDAQIRENARHVRTILAFTTPLGPAPFGAPPSHHALCDCEICGRPVAPAEQSGYALRHGATCHVNCLTAEMDRREPR